MERKHSRRTLFKSNRAIISSAKLSCIMQTEWKKETHCKTMPKQLKTWQQQEVNEAELPLLRMEDPVGYCKLLTSGEQRMTFEMWFVRLVLLSALCNMITRKQTMHSAEYFYCDVPIPRFSHIVESVTGRFDTSCFETNLSSKITRSLPE